MRSLRLRVSVCPLAVFLFLTSARVVTAQSQTPSSLTVVQWNVYHSGKGTDNVKDLGRQVRWMAAQMPDVVSMNEVFEEDVAAYQSRLQTATGTAWQPLFVKAQTDGTGNLILTKLPVISTVPYHFVAYELYQRAVIEATLDLGGRQVSFFSVHLDNGTSQSRPAEIAELLQFMSKFPEPRIIAGDFNAAPTFPEMQSMYANYIDTWESARLANTAVAYPPDNPVAPATWTQWTRIDYVLLSDGLNGTAIDSIQIPDMRDFNNTKVLQKVGTNDDLYVRPSDHNMVVARLHLQNVSPTGDTTPPTVTLADPGAASLSGTVTLHADAADTSGIRKVQFLVDGAFVGTARSFPYEVAWDTAQVAAGTHALEAIAVDNDGYSTATQPTSIVTATATAPASTTTTTGPSGSTTPAPTTTTVTPTSSTTPSATPTTTVPAPAATAPAPATSSGTGDVVIYPASQATKIAGRWSVVADTSAAGGQRLQNPDAGAAKVATPGASPADYFEVTFSADAGKPYRLWLRGLAQGNSYNNDSVYVQFSDAVTSAGAPVFGIATTSATSVVLEDCNGCGVKGWGWQDNGYGVNVLGPTITFATSGVHTLRVQAREDGIGIDQILLSPSTYLTTPPGATKNDTVILPVTSSTATSAPSTTSPAPTTAPTSTTTPPPTTTTTSPTSSTTPPPTTTTTAPTSSTTPPPATTTTAPTSTTTPPPTTTTTAPTSSTTPPPTTTTTAPTSTTTPPPATTTTEPTSTTTSTPTTTTTAPTSTTTPTTTTTTPTSPTTPTPTTTPTAPAPTTTAPATATSTGTGDVVIYPASHATKIAGRWSVVSDASAAGGQRLQNPDAGAAKVATPSATPADYFEVTFSADAGKPYRLWLRGLAQGNSYNNDSVYVQFSDAVTSAGAPVYGIGSMSATSVVLEDCNGCGVKGWGWQDNGYGVNVLGPTIIFATSGMHTLRIQAREDGLGIDQILLSPSTYLTTPPGATKNDTTIF